MESEAKDIEKSSEEGSTKHDSFDRPPMGRPNLKSLGSSSAFSFMNPTEVRLGIRWRNQEPPEKRESSTEPITGEPTDSVPDLELLWRARDNRKGRGSIAMVPNDRAAVPSQPAGRRVSRDITQLGKNILRMFTVFPYWDMAYLVGMAYTIGSTVWVINGFFIFLPTAFPSTEFTNETTTGNGVTAFMGVTFFEIGAYLALLEAINDGSFHGSAMQRIIDNRVDGEKLMVDEKLQSFFRYLTPFKGWRKRRRETKEAYSIDPEAGWRARSIADQNPRNIYPPGKAAPKRRGGVDMGGEEGETAKYETFKFWFSWNAFKMHHIHEIGFIACLIQFTGATIFLVCGIVALPPIMENLSQWQLNAAYWIPQIVASSMFITPSLLFMIETQEKWYKPEPTILGWWIGFWALIGSIGFEMCGSLGPAYGSTKAQYQMALSSFWGSWAFLIGSVLQLYEAVNKHPVAELFNEPGHLRTWEIHPI